MASSPPPFGLAGRRPFPSRAVQTQSAIWTAHLSFPCLVTHARVCWCLCARPPWRLRRALISGRVDARLVVYARQGAAREVQETPVPRRHPALLFLSVIVARVACPQQARVELGEEVG